MLALLLIFGVGACTKNIDDAEALYRSGDKDAALDVVEELMESEDPGVRRRAIKLAGDIGNDRAGRLMVRALQDPSPDVQKEAVRGLGKNAYEPGIEPIIDLLPKADPDVLRAAASALGQYGKPGLDALVERYVTPSESGNRGLYRQVFLQIGAPAAEALIVTLKGKSFFENRDTFALLEEMQNPRVATLMLPYLENEEVAEQVVEAIGRLGSKAVAPTLESIKGYSTSPDDVRVLELHIRILGKLKDNRAIPTLESLATHPDELIRDATDFALTQVRGF
jgi:HEAT repeat protein